MTWTKKSKLTISLLSIAVSGIILISSNKSYAVNLKEVYQQATKEDKTYQSAKFTYDSQKTLVPIARASFMPTLTLAAYTQAQKTTTSPQTTSTNNFQNTQDALFTLTESLSWATFESYAQAKYKVLIAELAYRTAYQNLITNTATIPNTGIVNQYFQIINDIDNLTASRANLDYSTKFRDFTKSQYEVGLVAKTTLDSAIQGYAGALATLVKAKNQLSTDINTLSVSTKHHYNHQDFATLKPNFKLSKPNPDNINDWADMAEKNNLTVLSSLATVKSDKKQIGIDNSGYFPNLSLSGSYEKNKASETNITTNTTTYAATVNWNIGAFATLNDSASSNTFYGKRRDVFALKADQETLKYSQRKARVDAKTSYLNIISDISQIKAYRQAVISGKASLDAASAMYQAGTGTLISVLQEQKNWFDSYKNLSGAIQLYFNHRVALKQSVGQLSEKDIDEINGLLVTNWNPSMSSTGHPDKKTKVNKPTDTAKPKMQPSTQIEPRKQINTKQNTKTPPLIAKKTPAPNNSSNNSSNTTQGGLHFHTHYH